jgi:RNA recognition motif-containing protein
VNKDCRVYVSNLPFEVTWHQLKDFMREGKLLLGRPSLSLPYAANDKTGS